MSQSIIIYLLCVWNSFVCAFCGFFLLVCSWILHSHKYPLLLFISVCLTFSYCFRLSARISQKQQQQKKYKCVHTSIMSISVTVLFTHFSFFSKFYLHFFDTYFCLILLFTFERTLIHLFLYSRILSVLSIPVSNWIQK